MMVKDLIKELEKFDGDVEVILYTDHGQSHEGARCVDLEVIAYDDDISEGVYDLSWNEGDVGMEKEEWEHLKEHGSKVVTIAS